jgi:hypothetical protein
MLREAAHDTVFSALIDTGADFMLVPLTWLVQIDAPESRYAHVRGLWSEQQQVTWYMRQHVTPDRLLNLSGGFECRPQFGKWVASSSWLIPPRIDFS